MRPRILVQIVLIVSAAVVLAVAGSDWITDVPARDQVKVNPLRDQPEAVQAGRLLFTDHCAQCHGENAQGKSKRPSLRSARLQAVSEGSLHWLLVNGNVRRGMPAWSKLPDQQLWQLVAYLKSLQARE